MKTIKYILKNVDSDHRFIFNDVSGKFDDDVKHLLNTYRNLSYVFCHNLCDTRKDTSNHMNYVDCDLDIKRVKEFLITANSEFKDRVYVDACFGFSKSLEQNYELINDYEELLKTFDMHVFGVSKKSFLQAMCFSEDKDQRKNESETYHQNILSNLFKSLEKCSGKSLLVRVHDPRVVKRALEFNKVFNA